MAQAVDHGDLLGGPRHGTGHVRPVHPGRRGLVLGGIALVAAMPVLAVLDPRWPEWAAGALFTAWFVAGVAWADAARVGWRWAVSVGLGLLLLLAASVLPSTQTPPNDAWAWAVALSAALGTGFTLGPAVGALLARTGRRGRR